MDKPTVSTDQVSIKSRKREIPRQGKGESNVIETEMLPDVSAGDTTNYDLAKEVDENEQIRESEQTVTIGCDRLSRKTAQNRHLVGYLATPKQKLQLKKKPQARTKSSTKVAVIRSSINAVSSDADGTGKIEQSSKFLPYICLKCKAAFIDQSGLSRHFATCVFEQEFWCTNGCGMKFAMNWHMKRHANRNICLRKGQTPKPVPQSNRNESPAKLALVQRSFAEARARIAAQKKDGQADNTVSSSTTSKKNKRNPKEKVNFSSLSKSSRNRWDSNPVLKDSQRTVITSTLQSPYQLKSAKLKSGARSSDVVRTKPRTSARKPTAAVQKVHNSDNHHETEMKTSIMIGPAIVSESVQLAECQPDVSKEIVTSPPKLSGFGQEWTVNVTDDLGTKSTFDSVNSSSAHDKIHMLPRDFHIMVEPTTSPEVQMQPEISVSEPDIKFEPEIGENTENITDDSELVKMLENETSMEYDLISIPPEQTQSLTKSVTPKENNTPTTATDECDAFGTYIAETMRSLEPMARAHFQLRVSQMVYEAKTLALPPHRS